jgi:hypothetical protein
MRLVASSLTTTQDNTVRTSSIYSKITTLDSGPLSREHGNTSCQTGRGSNRAVWNALNTTPANQLVVALQLGSSIRILTLCIP